MSVGRETAGFTLVELLVAFSLLLVGMTGIIALFAAGLRLERQGTLEYEGAVLLDELRPRVRQALLEQLKAGDAESLGIERTAVPSQPGLFYQADAVRMPDDPLGHGWLVTIKVFARQTAGEREYSLGLMPMRLGPEYDELVRGMASGK